MPATTKEEEINAIRNLRLVLNTTAGQTFFGFLLKEFDVLGGPAPYLADEHLREEIAYRRYGATIINYIMKANPLVLGELTAKIAREKHNEYINENEPTDEDESAEFR